MIRLRLGTGLLAALLVAGAGLARAQPAQDDLVKRGEYLTRAADCQACHSAPGAPSWIGGRAFVTPMGTLYSPNITPDHDTGIGQYTDAEFISALHEGVGRGGKHLYPAMPYNSYTRMSNDDALAIKAYLFTLKPVHATAPVNQMKFPFNQRVLMVFWNVLNNPDKRWTPDSGKPADWNRGAYLVQALGHCEQCHTPRNMMQGLSSRAYAGAPQQGWSAWNITNDRVHGIGGWSDAALVQYLGTGYADKHGPASGPMAEAVSDSLRYLTSDDIKAMVVYLRSIPARDDGVAIVDHVPSSQADHDLGGRLFAQACVGCHLLNGAGRQKNIAALAGAHSVGDPAGLNLTQVMLGGSHIETNDGEAIMPGFAGGYSDHEFAALSNYVIAHFGGRTGTVTDEAFAKARPAPSDK